MQENSVFLDDKRVPAHVLEYIKDGEYAENKWIIARSYDDFVNCLMEFWNGKNALPELVSLDHDLAEEHIKYYFENGGHENPPNPLNATFTEKTGFDCALWLVDFCRENNVRLPRFKVHSKNKYGRINIESLLTNFKKTQDANL